MDDPEVPRALVQAARARPIAMPHTLIRSVAQKAGVPKHDVKMLWLVRDALSAPMPPGWEAAPDGEGWRNVERGETVKSHPCLSYLRRAIAKESKAKESRPKEKVAPAEKGSKRQRRPPSGRSAPMRLEDGIKLGDADAGGEGYGLRRGGPWLECTESAATGGPLATYWYHFGQRKRLNEHPAVWLARRRQRAAVEIQRSARGMLARHARAGREERGAAIVLQSVYRMLSARYLAKQKRRWRVEAKTIAAIVVVQKVWRGRGGRRRAATQRVLVWQAEEQRSAAAIQACWRERSAGRHRAAGSLQARWRGVRGRRAAVARRSEIENEAWRRKCAAEEEAKRRVEAEARARAAKAEKARKIAEAAAAAEAAEAAAEAERLRIAALYAENRRREQEHRASASMQAHARGWLCRKELKRQRSAASKLQAIVRGDRLRRERRDMVTSVIRLQAQRRGQVGRRIKAARIVEVQHELERSSSTLLQCAARRWLGRRSSAAAVVQARWRGRAGRQKALKRRAKVARRAQRAAEAKARSEDFRRAALDALDLGDPVGNISLRSAKYRVDASPTAGGVAASPLASAVGRGSGSLVGHGVVSGVRNGAVSALGALEGEPARRAATTGGLGLRSHSKSPNTDWRPDGRTQELVQTDLLPKFGQLDGGRRFAELRSAAQYGLTAGMGMGGRASSGL